MRRVILALCLAATMILLAAPVNQASAQDEFKGTELFPMSVFSRWTYRVQGQDDRLVVMAAAIEKIGEYRCYRFEGRLRNQLVASEQLSLRKDGVFRMRHDGMDLEPPLMICRFPPLKGEIWKAEYKIGDKKTMIAFECDTEVITVNDTKYHTFVIKAEIAESGGKLKNTCWYAPKVGLVKQVIEDGDNQIVLELEKYERGPEKKGSGKAPSP